MRSEAAISDLTKEQAGRIKAFERKGSSVRHPTSRMVISVGEYIGRYQKDEEEASVGEV